MNHMSFGQWIAKDTFDRLAALVLLVAATPVLLVAAILIKLSSRGPILFRQERIGLNQQPFQINKLRTMHVQASNHALGTVTVRNDPRVFAVGRWIRWSKIDELPQLVNVFIGNMSLVGPRPTVHDDYKRMSAEQKQRAEVRPGITGLAQVNGGASLMWPEKIKLDLHYIHNYSFHLDLKILLQTAWLVLFFRGDRNPEVGKEWPDEEDAQSNQAA